MREYKWDGEFDDAKEDWQLTDYQRERVIELLKTLPKAKETKRRQIASGLCSANFDYTDFVSVYGNGYYSEWCVGSYTIATVIWYLHKYYGDDCLTDKRKIFGEGERLNKFF